MLSDKDIQFLRSKFISSINGIRSQKKETKTSIGITPIFFCGYKLVGQKITADYALRVLLFIFSFIEEFPYWETEKIYRTLQNRAFLGNYQGKWHLVQEFLELENPNLDQAYQIWQNHGGSFRTFQNLFKEVRLKRDIYVSATFDSRPIHRPQRKRGYDDKGSRRLPHEYHGIPGKLKEEDPERLDRRNKVQHPLIEKKEERKTTADEDWENSRSDLQKEKPKEVL